MPPERKSRYPDVAKSPFGTTNRLPYHAKHTATGVPRPRLMAAVSVMAWHCATFQNRLRTREDGDETGQIHTTSEDASVTGTRTKKTKSREVGSELRAAEGAAPISLGVVAVRAMI